MTTYFTGVRDRDCWLEQLAIRDPDQVIRAAHQRGGRGRDATQDRLWLASRILDLLARRHHRGVCVSKFKPSGAELFIRVVELVLLLSASPFENCQNE